MKFAGIPAYQTIKDRLCQAADSGHVAHAQLFAASEGGFGIMMALAYAQYLNCEQPAGGDSCGSCVSCIKSSRFVHPDFHYLFPLAKSKKVDSDELNAHMPAFRNYLSEEPWGGLHEWAGSAGFENRTPLINIKAVRETIQGLQLKAFEAKYKIQIVWLPETLRSEGANALLKILEEPPPLTVFLVVSHQADALLPTLLSRMQRISLPAPSEVELSRFLQSRFPEEDASRLKMAASLAEGSIPLALRLLEEKPDDYHNWYMNWQRACFKKDHSALLALAEGFQEMGKELQKSVLQYSIEKTRKALLLAGGAGEILQLQETESRELPNLGKILHPHMVEKMLLELDKAWYHIDRNAAARMVFFDASMAISEAYRIPVNA